MTSNPLQQYFRQPAIWLRLPSGGKFWPPGTLEPTENNEYPVLPMTTMDEITYKTPDALFNGSGVVNVIQSCVPNIKNAWMIPSTDIDTILIAVRIATYGHELEIDASCPQCNHEESFGVDLRQVLDQIKMPDYVKPLRIGDLELYFRPMSYQQLNDNSMSQFQEQKSLQLVQESNEEEQKKLQYMGEILKKLTEHTTKALAKNIAVIKTPTAQVDNTEHIWEWLNNCDRKIFNQIRDHVIEVKSVTELKPLQIKCSNCSNEYKQIFTLDMSNFFAVAS